MMARLGDLFLHIRNGANIKQGLDNIGYPITRIETISNRTVDRNKMGYAGITDLEKYSDFVMQDGDILMSHINSETHLGKTALYEKEGDEIIIHGMNLLSLRPNKDLITSKYAFYYLSSQSFLRQIPNITKKSVNQASFTVSALKELAFPILSIEEQKKITLDLDKVNDLISLRKQQLSKLDELVKSRFIEMFGDQRTNPFGWDMVTIGDIATEVRYGTSRPAVEGGKYPYLRMNNLTYEGYLDLTDLKYIDIPDNEIEKCVVRKGDVLFNRTNSVELVGKTCVYNLDYDMIIAGYIIRVRIDDRMLPVVLSNYLNSTVLKEQLRSMAKGAVNQANINAQELQSIPIYLPPIDLQHEFVVFVEQIDKSKYIEKISVRVLTIFWQKVYIWK